jgi:hypothetical protein
MPKTKMWIKCVLVISFLSVQTFTQEINTDAEIITSLLPQRVDPADENPINPERPSETPQDERGK